MNTKVSSQDSPHDLEITPRTIGLVGYPKSGITWLQTLIAGLVYGIDLETAPDAVIQTLVPDVHWKGRPKGASQPPYFKSHELPRPDYRRVVYILRDGRDVMVSYFHFLAALHETPPDFLAMARGQSKLVPVNWHDHVEQWLANPHRAEMLVIRYEHLRAAPVAELAQICDFADIPCDKAGLTKIAASTTFEKMRGKEAAQGLANPMWPRDKFFFRRGKVGSYSDEMPAEVLEAFLQEARPTLIKTGYLEKAAA